LQEDAFSKWLSTQKIVNSILSQYPNWIIQWRRERGPKISLITAGTILTNLLRSGSYRYHILWSIVQKGLVRVVKLKCTVGRLGCLTGLGYGTGLLQARAEKATTLSWRKYS